MSEEVDFSSITTKKLDEATILQKDGAVMEDKEQRLKSGLNMQLANKQKI